MSPIYWLVILKDIWNVYGINGGYFLHTVYKMHRDGFCSVEQERPLVLHHCAAKEPSGVSQTLLE